MATNNTATLKRPANRRFAGARGSGTPDQKSPYTCPLCCKRLVDVGGYWGCLCNMSEDFKRKYRTPRPVSSNDEMDESARLWRKASRIENTRLKRLGATLAMFDTVPLGGDGLDKREVVLQNL